MLHKTKLKKHEEKIPKNTTVFHLFIKISVKHNKTNFLKISAFEIIATQKRRIHFYVLYDERMCLPTYFTFTLNLLKKFKKNATINLYFELSLTYAKKLKLNLYVKL